MNEMNPGGLLTRLFSKETPLLAPLVSPLVRVAEETLVSQASASTGSPTLSYIKGNYNGLVAKTITGSTIYVVAVPSIVTSQTGTLVDVLTLSGKLLVNNKTNSGGVNFLPSVVFSGASLPINDSASGITNLVSAIQNAYSGSSVASVSAIANLLSTTGSTNVVSLGSSIITNSIGGIAAVVPSNRGSSGGSSYSVTNSLMFDSTSSQYLSRTPSVAGNQKTWTWSAWIKRGQIGVAYYPFSVGNGSQRTLWGFNSSDQINIVAYPSYSLLFASNAVFRDPSAWYHIVLSIDTTQATQANGVRVWVNNQLVSWSGTPTYTQNFNTDVNSTVLHNLGRNADGTAYLDGYLSDINFVDVQALTPSAFATNDSISGQWEPMAYTGSYGNNGFHLTFSSGSALGADTGSGNSWTTYGSTNMTAAANQVTDTPNNNFATLNSLDKSQYVSSANGNLTATTSGGSNYEGIRATMALPSTGKWYWEVKYSALGYITGLGIANGTTNIVSGGGFSKVRTLGTGSWFNTYNGGSVQYDTDCAPSGCGTNWA